MPKFKMYVLSDDGHVITRANLYCDGVQQAKELAKALVDGKPWLGPNRALRSDALKASAASTFRAVGISFALYALVHCSSPLESAG